MRVLPASPDNLAIALQILRSGGVIAHATETCYGLACDLSNPDAVAKLFAIKQRPPDQPVSALFASVEEAKKYVEWNDEAQRLADKYLPGPLTMILPIHAEAHLFPTPNPNPTPNPTLGIRVSSSSVAHQLVYEFESPISTTSANLHAHPNPYSAADILNQFSTQKHHPDLILDSGPLPPTPPSTVINLTDPKRKIERSGGIVPSKKKPG